MKKIIMWVLCLSCMHVKAHSTDDSAFHVGILLFEGAQAIDFVGPTEVFGQAGFRITTLSKEGQAITTAMGLQVTPHQAFTPSLQLDALLIPGGNINDRLLNDVQINQWIKAQSDSAQYVMSVCNGAFILANTGLLDGLQATTIEKAFSSFERHYPKVILARDKKFTDNGKILTTAGLSSGIDGALSLVAKVRGQRVARSVAAKIEYNWQPNGGYIRGKMADRILPVFDGLPDEVTLLSRTFHYGSEHSWYTGYTFEVESHKGGLLATWLTQQMTGAGWQQAGDNHALAWSRKVDNSVWLVHVNLKTINETQLSAHLSLTQQF
ncbi:DJ-1/PfpI family protein [Pseudoalteromonas sp. SMS1]|uniref:DJ-1/PfpI family protein n=1 Tax=Pseudoalteromonas sp. SMS1 TaxID=2908894 RepID=UPI001F30CCB9|nr:DJ-1/PfpI family protein [Pseudoalteromonas sp. SMS1]MCF2859248.1 DJ-1/PfpI family protein [Pseudoalteromonas sp. SMS1]